MPAGSTLEADDLVETDPAILEQVRKDLNQEYVRLMSRALQTARQPAANGSAQAAASGSNDKST
jgi:hypothetical protein